MKSLIFIIILIATCLILTNPDWKIIPHIKKDIIKGFPEGSQATGVINSTMRSFILKATTVKNYYLFSTFQFNAADLDIDLEGFKTNISSRIINKIIYILFNKE